MSLSDGEVSWVAGQRVRTPSRGLDRAAGVLFDTRQSRATRLVGVTHVEGLVDGLRTDRKPQLYRTETEAMAIGETSFFRDWPTFEVLRDCLVPELLARRNTERCLRIWSAGCSTGQETYSVAMLLADAFPGLAGWDVKVVGTDLSVAALQAAREGRYRRHELTPGLMERYVRQDGGGWVVVPQIRAMCEFILSDLRTMTRAFPPFDLVLLRNVLLYFDPAERSGVLEGVRSRLAGDGVLVLGASERAEDFTTLFIGELTPGCYVYRPASQVHRPG